MPPLPDPEKLACLLYTSGTSGRPRAAMLTHRALIANIDQAAEVEPPMIHGDDVVLGVLPLFHVYGLNAVLGGVLRHRAKLVLAERFDPQATLDLIDDEAVSVVPVAPPVFAYWLPEEHLRERLGPVRLILSGSAPLSPELVERFTEATGIPVHQGYGLTEAVADRDQHPVQRGAADRLGGRRPARASRSSCSTRSASAPEGDDPGEIWIRGANLFSGYWPDGDGGPDAEGWWGTGDVGFLDEAGDLFLVDRLKELVIVSGFNVYPIEVEDVIREVDGVVEAAVIGVEDPVDRRGGRRLRRTRGRGCRGCGRRRPRPLRRTPGPLQAADAGRGRRRPAADGDREGAEGPAAWPRAPALAGAAGVRA